MTRTILDISILQTVPPSNINRDDTGSPKTAVYGGAQRARVSSQAWKRAARLLFDETLDRSELGMRTKRLVEELAERAVTLNPELEMDEAARLSALVFTEAGIKLKPPRAKKGEEAGLAEAEFLFFLSNSQFDRLARIVVDAAGADDEKLAIKEAAPKKVMKEQHSVDVALFGRMVADHTDLNVDAAAQVAHAISVHAVENDYDYFTAVDDAKDREAGDDAGAAMIGVVEFNSSTLYRYATVDVNRLHENLGDATAVRRAVEAFVRSFVTSMPSGKQNTFANRTLPTAIAVSLRDTQAVNLVGAFESPVLASSGAAEAVERLVDHAIEIDGAFGTTPVHSWVVGVGKSSEHLGRLGDRVNFAALVDGVGEAVAERIAD